MSDPRLDEQIDYYRAIANEYEHHKIDAPGQRELLAAFAQFNIEGDVLELTCGTGNWTEQLVDRATTITSVDASPEMIHRAKNRLGDKPARFIAADLFTWRPDRQYDSVFFGFWLSHVPEERFAAFWTLVAACLKPGGRVFFLDDNHRSEQELIEGPNSPVVERRLMDGTTFRAIKVPHQPDELKARVRELGWSFDIAACGPFYWGAGSYERDD